ncbi:hypothetical protein AB0M29_04650 [Streptomyces sp. NPDC051976]|uniref:hypothetical protein n=1 Tax=Streptomyces sp. NPDC051976 TaxID=3154947 RepID=UPI00344AEEEF
MTESLPATAVVRASRATFDPSRFAEVDAMNTKTSQYLIPAVKQLSGLLHFYAGVSPDGTMLQLSVWDSEEHSAQLNHLKEMVVIARGEMEAVGVSFTPVATYPVSWTI